MINYLLKRILPIIPVAFTVVTIVALMIHMVPGDPVDSLLGDFASAEERHNLREALGLNQPIAQQLQTYFSNLTQGNLGTSLIYNEPVAQLISKRALPTLELALLALLIAISIGIPLGTLSALSKDKFLDHASMALALSGVAIPNFWLGPLLIWFFSLKLGWLPVSERAGFASYILPGLTLGTALASILSRMTRNSMLEVLQEPYMQTARAKGCSSSRLILKHALKNAFLPTISILGLQLGTLMTGAVITERIFDWPGLGSLVIDGLNNRDYPLVQGCVLVFSVSYLFINLLTDLACAAIDPRIKLNPSRK